MANWNLKKCCNLKTVYDILIKPYLRRNKLFLQVTLTLYILTFMLILPLITSQWPHSIYFSPGKDEAGLTQRAFENNEKHLLEAEQYFRSLTASEVLADFTDRSQSRDIELAVVVVTVPRQHQTFRLGYLEQVMASLHREIVNDTNFYSSTLHICDTNPGPGEHRSAKKLAEFFPLIKRFPEPSAEAAILNRYKKEQEDYMFCLHTVLESNPTYVLMMEDDAVPRPHLFSILKHTLLTQIEKRYSNGEHILNSHPWSFLKLYYPTRWQGYGWDLPVLIELVSIGLIGAPVFCLIYIYCIYQRAKSTDIYVAFFIGWLYFVLIAIMVSRQHLLELRRFSPYTYRVHTAPGCCSPAMLYTREMAEQLVDYMREVDCRRSFPIDLAMEQFAEDNNYHRYIIEPNIIKHIGFVSSIKHARKVVKDYLD